MKHRRVVVARRGGPEVLQVTEEVLRSPAAGEVRVKTEAAGVSGFDCMIRSGWFPGFPRTPFTPGVDVVGVVDAVGEGVATIEPGQRVAALLGFGLGGYAEHVCLPARDAVPVPPGVDPVDAVCVVANYTTAHVAMHPTARVESGERILVHGAAGGVGSALVELGRVAGLDMYGTASRHNHGLVASLGAIPIDYRAEDFVSRIRSLTTGGVDVVFDPVGGARQLWRSSRALRKGGRLVWFGVAASKTKGTRVIPASLLMRLGLILIPNGKRALTTPDVHKDNALYRETLSELLDLLSGGKIDPVIADRIPMIEARRAHELLDHGGYAGKVVLVAGE